MKGRRLAVLALLLAAFVLRHDLWLAHDGRLVLGLPASLAFHAGYCVVLGLVMALLFALIGPRREAPEEKDRPR